MKKILFLAHHRLNRSPGQRYRFEQFFDYLQKNEILCYLSFIIYEKDEKALYYSKNIFGKVKLALNSIIRRIIHIKNIKDFDLVVIYREALPFKSTFFENYIAKKKIPMVYDFDDAIWVKDVSEVNKKISFFKDEKKIEKILPLCKYVTCGNEYLANFALKFNSNVVIIPSTVDTDIYKPIKKNNINSPVKIGWVGSHTTIKHFELISDVYLELKTKYNNKVEFIVIGDENYKNEKLNLQGKKWENDKEVQLFNSFDIGVMPLPNNDWTKGKCGMKGLLYMSVGLPTVMSNVGMNKDIINDGINGFLPTGNQEWIDVLSKLIEDKDLRTKIGNQGRETVLEKYSKNVIKKTYLNLYSSIINKHEKNNTLQ